MSNEISTSYKIRNAVMSDVLCIQTLINAYAKSDIMLAKSLNQLYENIRDYVVLEREGKVVACGALHFFWEDLAEIRSLAVSPECSKNGYGSIITRHLIEQANVFGVKKVFALTLVPNFFLKLGFKEVPHSELPQKVYKDCINCVKLGNCDEIALIKYLEN